MRMVKTITKKAMAATFATICMLSTFTASVYAETSQLRSDNVVTEASVTNTGVNMNQTPVILEDRLEQIKNDDSMSEEKRQKHIEKIEYMINLRDSSNKARATYTHTKYGRTLSVPFCKQDNNEYCGPATAQQTYKFYNGTAPSQRVIATGVKYTAGVGCDVQNILDYLNNELDTAYEQFWLSSNATNQNGSIQLICESIDNGCPPIMWVSVSSTWGGNRDLSASGDTTKWPYTVGGHFLNASGYTQNGQLYQMTDPWLTWVYTNNQTGKFWVNNYTTYMVTNVVSA